MEKIIIRGARVHNLKNINLALPKNKIIVFSGVSGSGKSSLAFDTIFAEGQRRYIESLSPYARQFLGEMKRAEVDEISGLSPAIAIDQKALSHNPRSTVGTLTEIYDYLRVLYARVGEVFCPICDRKIEKLSLEEMVDIILAKAKEAGTNKITVLSPVVRGRKGEYYQLFYDFLSVGYAEIRLDGQFRSLHEKLVLSRYKVHHIDLVIDKLLPDEESRLFEAVENALSRSQGLVTVILDEGGKNQSEFMLSSKWTCPNDNFTFPEVEPRLFSFNSPYGACPTCHGLGKDDLFLKKICPACQGKRLKPEALAVRIGPSANPSRRRASLGKNIAEVTEMPIAEIFEFFENYQKKMTKRQREIAANVVKEIIDRLNFLLKVGLEYISLNREAETLSGGEAQRIRLASQVGSQLSNTLYVLDEPTIGLHERDTERLLKTLQALKERSNTIIVVEHDERTLSRADYLVDLGPLAGRHGGEVVAEGEISRLLNKPPKGNSLTLDYLTGKRKIELPKKRRQKNKGKIGIVGARAHNLKNISVDLPLGRLICLTGVSGSGKSSLLYESFYKNITRIKSRINKPMEGVSRIAGAEYVDKIVMITQSPIGRTPRSNPATYTGVFTPIRNFYSLLDDSRERGYTASRFSFNVSATNGGGRCEACGGAGHKLIEMHFLPPVLVECDVCHGKRFTRETLQVKYKNKNIADVLAMTIDEAADFFKDNYLVADKLKVLRSVGLGYLQLGQSATTLSGGEAQRIKLGRELTQPLGKKSLYLLDEPTVGLHYYDIEMLLKVLNKLVEKGNTVVVIEHNMHIIKSADYIIDLGPEGGANGGRLIAKGAPEEIVRQKESVTGKYLKAYL